MNRFCLKCRDSFESQHSGNRLCDSCRPENGELVKSVLAISGEDRIQSHERQRKEAEYVDAVLKELP